MDLAKLKAAASAATPGPWVAGNDEDSDYYLIGPHDGDGLVYQPVVKLHSEANADYISTANPTAILELIARLEAAEKLLLFMRSKWVPNKDIKGHVVLIDAYATQITEWMHEVDKLASIKEN